MRTILAILCCTLTVTAADAATVKPKPVHVAQTVGKAPPTPTPAPVAKKTISQTAAAANPLSVLQGLAQFTITDLQAALADANAQTPPDTTAAMCYTELLTVLNGNSSLNLLPTELGAFEILQKARDLQSLTANLQSNNGPLSMLNVACAPLVISVQNTLIQLGILGGVVIK